MLCDFTDKIDDRVKEEERAFSRMEKEFWNAREELDQQMVLMCDRGEHTSYLSSALCSSFFE